MKTYCNIPMSLANASLVRLAEMHERPKVMTLASDFVACRKSSRTVMALLWPEPRDDFCW
jgi:hypothetical protein